MVLPSAKGRAGRGYVYRSSWNDGGAGDMRDAGNSTDWSTGITSLPNVTDTTTAAAVAALTNKKITNLQANLPEDMRISKLLRQLAVEKDADQVTQVCRKLHMAIEDTTNGNYIRRSFDILAETIMRVFKEGPLASMADVADVFGLMGYVMRSDFAAYRSWLARMYKTERIRVWVMRALVATLRKDEHNRDLRADTCNRLIELLKEYLENVDNADHFVAITNAIEQFALNYPKQFQTHFPDIVDIVVGWHLETDQTNVIKQHCSRILQSFQPFWINDLHFTRNLLGQFLEDMVSYRDEIQPTTSGSDADAAMAPPEICFGSIVGCTNSILKCIYDTSATLSQHVGVALLNELFLCVIDVMQLTIENGAATPHNDAIYMGANELIIITLDCIKYGVDLPEAKLIDVVALQLHHLNVETDPKQTILAILFVVYKLICALKTKLPLSLIRSVFGANRAAIGHRLLFSHDVQVRKAAVRIHHAVLNLKNVEILQEAYGIIRTDLDEAMATIYGADTQLYSKREAEFIISTHLSILSTLAISNSSIIVMWALQPTILETLTNHLHTSDYDTIWHQYPETHFAILQLITAHCRNNNNFVASSALLNTKLTDVFGKLSLEDSTTGGGGGMKFSASTASTETSPTSAHFDLILKFVARILAQKRLTDHHLIDLLDWCVLIISQSAQYSQQLSTNSDFKSIIEHIIRIAAKWNGRAAVEKCGDCLLVMFAHEHMHNDWFLAIAEVCCMHMCSVDPAIRSLYSHIFAKLPLNVALRQVNQFTGVAKSHARYVSLIQHWHTRKPIAHGGGDMRPHYFSNFIRSIKMLASNDGTATDEFVESILQYMLIRSWAHSSDFDEADEVNGIRADFNSSLEYRTIAVNDIRSVIAWAQWEAAQFCVNNKLRTVLGKPQETFLKIESIIKEDARVLSSKTAMMSSVTTNIHTIIANQRHTRVLLGFMEALEKSIYNASEGTAVALTPADKPAKTFFHINAPTCNEWFNRIRTAVDWVALNSMEPEMVIRYTEAMLCGLVGTDKTNESLFDHTLMTHAWALLRNGESNALQGLFTWTKNKTQKRVLWIKFVAGKFLNRHCSTVPISIKFWLFLILQSKRPVASKPPSPATNPYCR